MLEAPHRYKSLHAIWDHSDLPTTQQRQHLPPLLRPVYLIYPPVKDDRLSRPEPTQVNDLPRVTSEVLSIPGVSWLSRPSVPLGMLGVAHSCYTVTGFNENRTHVFQTQVKRAINSATNATQRTSGLWKPASLRSLTSRFSAIYLFQISIRLT